MLQRAVRGAITVDNNTIEDITSGVVELISEINNRNEYRAEDISHVIFTMTDDLDCVYPAKIAREHFPDWQNIPLMCTQELKIKNSLEKCIRVLIVINTNISRNEIRHVYLKGAKKLREDLI